MIDHEGQDFKSNVYVKRLLAVLDKELSRGELMTALGLKDVEHFWRSYLQPALAAGLIERTIPDKSRSRFKSCHAKRLSTGRRKR